MLAVQLTRSNNCLLPIRLHIWAGLDRSKQHCHVRGAFKHRQRNFRPDATHVRSNVLKTEPLQRSQGDQELKERLRGRTLQLLEDSMEQSRQASSGDLLHCQHSGGTISAAGFPILSEIYPTAETTRVDTLPSGLLVSLSTADGRDTSSYEATLGKLTCQRFLACARIKLYWMAPEWGSRATEVPPETQFLLLQLGEEGPYAVVLPLIDSGKFRATLRPPRPDQDAPDQMRVRIESGDDAVAASKWKSAVFVAAGWDAYELIDQAVAVAGRLSGGAKPRREKQVPDFVDVFGWCTWDAFYSKVSARGLDEGLKALKEKQVPPKFLIIDDGWQQTGADSAFPQPNKQIPVPASPPQSRNEEPVSWSGGASLITQLSSRLQALVQRAIMQLYKGAVEEAPAGTWRILLFESLAKGVLRKGLLNFYAETSDHIQRLEGVRANGKFASSDTDSDADWKDNDNLAAVVKRIREEYGVKAVYCWHSLYGYWAGISEAMPFKTQLVYPKPSPGAGIDGVKVDCQSTLGMIGSGTPGLGGGPALAAQFHSALERSVQRHFPGNNCINCMCHSTEDLYSNNWGGMEDTSVARSSDDFWPTDPASHTTHVAVNAFNSVFMAALLQPDWDMFHSRHPAALLHATARVVSGGPLYVSDGPGKHDVALLKRVVLPDGSLLRCTQPGRPTVDCLFRDVMRDKTSLLKVWNENKAGGIVAAFNLQGSSWSRRARKYLTHDASPGVLSTVVKPSNLPAYQRGHRDMRFALWSDATATLSEVGLTQGVPCRLGPAGSDIITIMPLLQHGGARFAPIGLVNMLNTGGSIAEAAQLDSTRSSETVFTFKVRGTGKLLVFSSVEPVNCKVNQHPTAYEYSAQDNSVFIQIEDTASEVTISL